MIALLAHQSVQVSWESLRHTPGYLLNWALAGVSYVTCDIGGFNGKEKERRKERKEEERKKKEGKEKRKRGGGIQALRMI